MSIQIAPVGVRLYDSTVHIQESPTGQKFCWLGGPARGYDGGIHGDNCDIAICEQGNITLSILNLFGKEIQEGLQLKVQEACKKAQSVLSTYITYYKCVLFYGAYSPFVLTDNHKEKWSLCEISLSSCKELCSE